MARAPHFFAKPTPSRVEGVEYEPFPAEGEPVYTTHPAFTYDKGLRISLDSYHLYLAISTWKTKVKNPEATVEGKMVKSRAWVAGETPIPERYWKQMKQTRQEWLAERGLPLDSPIGFQHPDFQHSDFQHPDFQPPSYQPGHPAINQGTQLSAKAARSCGLIVLTDTLDWHA